MGHFIKVSPAPLLPPCRDLYSLLYHSEEKLSQITDSMLQLQQDLVQALLTLAQLAQCKMWIRSAQCT